MTNNHRTGKWNEKYGIMIFRANRGYQSIMKRIVNDYVKDVKKENPNIIVMEEIDDNKVKSWIIGSSENIKRMVNDEFDKKEEVV